MAGCPVGTAVPASDRFARATAAVVARAPWGLDRVLAPSVVGFAVLNSVTFAVDLALLTTLHGAGGWPLPASITTSYLVAFTLSFVLNRWLNFRSHAPLGWQGMRYAAVVAVNYLVWILGVGDGLTRVGVDYRLSRIVAAACEGVYMYCAMRWLVFGRGPDSASSRALPRHCPRHPACEDGAAGPLEENGTW